MRIRSVTAHAFGPLAAETLDFADGMTVIVGDNESAKSTWHAAIYAALCGRRRGAGRPRDSEQRFIDAHKPWDRDDWLVSAEIVLDDGRRIEMRQDLAGKIDCHALDLDLGIDVSDEVMNEGTPDASRWLGLDRISFSATASLEQAQMLQVRSEAGGLQQHLQRAAATAGADGTAAAALELIAAFAREHVGLDRANSTRPLRRAIENLHAANEDLEDARRAHQEYLRLAEQADDLTGAAKKADCLVTAYEAAAAAYRATQLANRADRATALHQALGDAPPASAADDDALARQVAGALAAWNAQPEEPTLTGPTSGQLRDRLNGLEQPAEPAERRTRPGTGYLLAAAGVTLAGVAVLIVVSKIGGAIMLAAAITVAAVGLYRRTRGPQATEVRRAAERARLQAELAARELAEQRAEQDRGKRSHIARMAVDAAAACGPPADTAQHAVTALQRWSAQRTEHMRRLAAKQEEWTQLQALLNGNTLTQLKEQAADARDHATALAAAADPALTGVIDPSAAQARLDDMRERARQAATLAARAQGELKRQAASVPSVPEAEEAAAAAVGELARVRDLQDTLTLTRKFLEAAQQRVHRDIAPVLSAAVRQWLPGVTSGRYTDVIVNPTTLAVQVCDLSRRWRAADQLSYGTTEQIYLLLRIALADQLTRNHDTCPLLLDDATVHADAARTTELLSQLLRIAAGRQVILFTQEEQVAAWAKAHLTEPGNAIRILTPLQTT